MKRYIIFAIVVPLLVWVGIATVGTKRMDLAGDTVWRGRGLLVPFEHGLLMELIGVSALLAYLTK